MKSVRPLRVAGAVAAGVLIASLAGGVGCSNVYTRSPPSPTTERVENAELVSRVSRQFKEAGLPGYERIRIVADDGAVTLSELPGEPVGADTRLRAVELARRVPGVDDAVWREGSA